MKTRKLICPELRVGLMTPPTRTTVISMKEDNWKEICCSKRSMLQESIPKEWIIPPNLYKPIQTHLNVLELPGTSGLLTAREIGITETTDVDTILHMLHTSQWSSVEVTKAFYKRAIVAHQSVRHPS